MSRTPEDSPSPSSLRSPTAPPLSRFASTSSLDSLSTTGASYAGVTINGSPIFNNRVPSGGWSKVGMGGDPSLQKKRARNLLRDYYGLAGQQQQDGVVGAGAGGGKGKGKEVDRGALEEDYDSPRFDPQRHAERLIATATIPELLKTANRLNREVRELDGERQGLVYNHHHELVEASGTIGKMKSTAETLDLSLDRLQASFSSISSLAGSLARPSPPHPLPPSFRPSPPSSTTSAEPSSSSTNPSSATTLPPPPPSPPRTFDPLLHLPPLLSLPALLRAHLSSRDRPSADRLWGEWEPALRSFEEAGVKGAKEVGDECREVLRSARRGSSAGEAPAVMPLTSPPTG